MEARKQREKGGSRDGDTPYQVMPPWPTSSVQTSPPNVTFSYSTLRIQSPSKSSTYELMKLWGNILYLKDNILETQIPHVRMLQMPLWPISLSFSLEYNFVKKEDYSLLPEIQISKLQWHSAARVLCEYQAYCLLYPAPESPLTVRTFSREDPLLKIHIYYHRSCFLHSSLGCISCHFRKQR